MHRRALHFASVLLLLASLSSADGAVPRNIGYSVGGHYLVVLMAQDHAAVSAIAASIPSADGKLALDLPPAAVSQRRATWTMRPPSAHSTSLHAVTGSSL